MSIGDNTENAILNLVFGATLWANYAINATASPETNIAMALHSADPGDAGTQSSSEIVYTSYARVNVPRVQPTNWTTSSAGSVSPAAAINFPAGTGGGPGPATFASAGKAAAATVGTILWSGAVSPSVTVGNGITPQLTTATVITLD